ncbi:uncharacterized protein HD556DRAFT_1217122, partial [Suillus plorans]
KFMPHFNGPYKIVLANPGTSTYMLDMPAHTNILPTFHASELKGHIQNDKDLYPSREQKWPKPFITTSGAEEWEIEKIIE